MSDRETVALLVLLRQRHWQKYSTFCSEYDKAARKVDASLVGTAPSRAQLARWTSGSLIKLPYPDHCRVLEEMFDGWTAQRLFSKWGSIGPRAESADVESSPKYGMSGVVGVFATRSAFSSVLPPHDLFDGARRIRLAGLSLNSICQQYPTRSLARNIDGGVKVCCLFLDPTGKNMSEREREEGFDGGELASLTRLNIASLVRLRDELSAEAAGEIEIGVYDEPIRYNITIIDEGQCIVQPYIPRIRGIESPTFVARKEVEDGSIFDVFCETFSYLKDRSKFL